MKRVLTLLLVICCLAGLRAQRWDWLRTEFERRFPPGSSYAVVVRGDLPTVGINGARGRERGRAAIPVEIEMTGWKQGGSLGREPATGTLARGEVMKIDKIEFSNDRMEIRLVSLEPHVVARDAENPERSRSEPVSTVLKLRREARDLRSAVTWQPPAGSGLVGSLGTFEIDVLLDPYVRLFGTLDEAQRYSASLKESRPDRRFTIAVVRRDGLMVPVASYDAGHWFNRWPLPAAERDVPLSMSDVPEDWWGLEGPGARWTLWTADGKSRPLELKGPVAFDAHCMMNVALKTDYLSPLPSPPLEQHHYPKDGIAISGSLPVEQVIVLNSAHGLWQSLEPQLASHVNYQELYQLLRTNAPGRTRPLPPLKLEVLVMAPAKAPGTFTAFFEAAKRYAPVDSTVPNPCGMVTFAHGWLHWKPGSTGKLDRNFEVRVSDCTQWNVDFTRPLGVVRVDGNPVWITEVSRWGSERYELVEIDGERTRVVVSVPGGWCKVPG